jgi:hypothetical protein
MPEIRCYPLSSRAEGGKWILVRITTSGQDAGYYMAGRWVPEEPFGKRIRGYGNTLAVLDRAPKEASCTYEIRPVCSPGRRRRAPAPPRDGNGGTPQESWCRPNRDSKSFDGKPFWS